jgi:SAM-dependent methyltransferase
MGTPALFERFYFSRQWYVSGTVKFHELIAKSTPPSSSILEIGAGPSNDTSGALASMGVVTGLDVDPEVKANCALSRAVTFDGGIFPLSDSSFDICVSNYVLEHVADPATHFREVSRVLRPGGKYFFRTPNIWHYVTIASRMLPHAVHAAIANRLRGLPPGSHPPYPTVYKANTRSAIRRYAAQSGLEVLQLSMVEAEPSYGAAHPLLFFPMMLYERIVNSSRVFRGFRVNIFGSLRKI